MLVTVKAASYLTISGAGDPNGPAFEAAMGALYAMAYTLKMAKKAAGKDYKVSGPEGLWWGAKGGSLLIDAPPATWRWKLVMRVPAFVAPRDRAAAVRLLLGKGKSALVAKVRLETLREGRCVQVLHVGPYREEHETIRRMEEFARARRLAFRGRHHEIYLNDPRRVAPAKLKTILRHPVRAR
jgi:hypothetical protein